MSHTPAHQTSGSTAAPAADRSSIIAVTALPVLVVIAGVLGFLLPDAFTPLAVMSMDVVESVEGYAANRRVVSVVVVEVEPAGQRQASFGL